MRRAVFVTQMGNITVILDEKIERDIKAQLRNKELDYVSIIPERNPESPQDDILAVDLWLPKGLIAQIQFQEVSALFVDKPKLTLDKLEKIIQ